MAKRTALFDKPRNALAFAYDYAQRQNRLASGPSNNAVHGSARGFVPHTHFHAIAHDHDGHAFHVTSSSDQRELELYDYKEVINPVDRFYLASKDPTGIFATKTMSRDVWRKPPRISRANEDRDEFRRYILELYRKGFFQQAWMAHKMARRDCGAFLFIMATGDPSEPLQAGDRFAGFDTIPIHAVPDQNIALAKDSNDALVRNHNVERILVEGDRNENDPTQTKTVDIHGSRLVVFKEDFESDKPFTRPVIDAIHDDLWNWRDVAVSARDGVMQGNPIAVDVKTEEEYSINRVPEDAQGTDEDPYQVIVEEFEDWQQGYIDGFAPIEGIELRRLGASEVEVPVEAIDSYVGRIASVLGVPASKIIATRSTDEQLNAETKSAYAGGIRAIQDTIAFPLLDHMIDVGKRIGLMPKRPELHPDEALWPDPIFYNARERAFVAGKHAQAAAITDELAVRNVPEETERRLPEADRQVPEAAQNQAGNNNEPGRNARASDDGRLEQRIREVIEEMRMSGNL